jgi:chromosomal replication initiator protein
VSGAATLLGATPAPPVPSIPPPPEQSFAAFVVGESNAAAYRAATALARGEIGGPLLLHGPSGVGKTHLLHAAYAGLAERGCGVACLAAHDLTEALLAARRANQAAAFWRELRALDALLLDDVHSLAGDEPLRGELADALAAWVEGGRILAVTTDRPPDEVPETGRWCPRDGAATVEHLPPPETALRIAIVRHKAEQLGLELGAELSATIAQRLPGSIRRLEGALTRLHALARLSGRPLDRRLVEEVLPPAPPVPSVERIVAETAAAFGLSAHRLRGRGGGGELVLPRRVAMWLMHRLLGLRAAEIGRLFQRDRTTVHHAYRGLPARLARDAQLARTVRRIEERLIGTT